MIQSHSPCRHFIFLTASIIAGVSLSAPAGPAAPFEIGGADEINATVDGQPVRLALLADGLDYPVLNPATATRLKLKGSIFSVRARVGKVALAGQTRIVRLGLEAREVKRRALWFERPISDSSDGALGPGSLAAAQVRFRLAEPRPGERPFELALVAQGPRMGTRIAANGGTIFVLFALDRDQTIASASAASDLAAAYSGAFRGETFSTPIRFGVARPVRMLALARPLRIGVLQISTFLTRIADQGSVAGIADEDPAEIVVVARNKRQTGERTLTIGRSALRGCSSLLFDKAAARIILSCSSQN